MQGRQGSNLRPTVLETATLPIELLPYLDLRLLIKQTQKEKLSILKWTLNFSYIVYQLTKAIFN